MGPIPAAVIRYDIAGTSEDKWLAYKVGNQPGNLTAADGLLAMSWVNRPGFSRDSGQAHFGLV